MKISENTYYWKLKNVIISSLLSNLIVIFSFSSFLFSLERITRLNIDLRADSLKRWTEKEKEIFTQRYENVNTGWNRRLMQMKPNYSWVPKMILEWYKENFYFTLMRCFSHAFSQAIRSPRGRRPFKLMPLGKKWRGLDPNLTVNLVVIKGATSRYFELFLPSTKFPLNWRKPENNTLQR